MYEDLDEQLVTYSAILDGLDTALAGIKKAENLHGLTELQTQSYLQLKVMYDAMVCDMDDLESEGEL